MCIKESIITRYLLLVTFYLLLITCYWLLVTQPANIGPQDVPRTSPEDPTYSPANVPI